MKIDQIDIKVGKTWDYHPSMQRCKKLQMLQIYLCYFFQLVLIFGPFWVIFGPFFGANLLWQNMPLCYLNRFLQLCKYGGAAKREEQQKFHNQRIAAESCCKYCRLARAHLYNQWLAKWVLEKAASRCRTHWGGGGVVHVFWASSFLPKAKGRGKRVGRNCCDNQS